MITMALKNLFGWSKMMDAKAGFEGGTACGAAKPEEKPASACGSACGAAKPEEKPSSACGASK